MRIRVDRDLCQGHAACVEDAPAHFALDAATDQVAVRNERPDESQRADVVRAIRHCPTRALRLEED